MNDSFIFYKSYHEAIQCLPEEIQLEAYKAICEYAITGEEPEGCNPIVKAIFKMAKPTVESNLARRENGKLGGAPKGNQNARKTSAVENKNNLKTTKNNHRLILKQPNVNVNDNVNANENVNVNYGELGNVRLTAEQYHTLKTKHSNIDDAIEVLDTWLGTSGSKHKNKNHYAYFKENSWVWDRVSQLPAKQNDDWLERLEREGNNETANQVSI